MLATSSCLPLPSPTLPSSRRSLDGGFSSMARLATIVERNLEVMERVLRKIILMMIVMDYDSGR